MYKFTYQKVERYVFKLHKLNINFIDSDFCVFKSVCKDTEPFNKITFADINYAYKNIRRMFDSPA